MPGVRGRGRDDVLDFFSNVVAMQRHTVVIMVTKKVEVSDPDDPMSSVEVEDLVEELENEGWKAVVQSVDPAGDEDLEEA